MHESADKMLHGYSRTNHQHLLCNNTPRKAFSSVPSLPSNNPPPLFLHFSAHPCHPIHSHTDPPRGRGAVPRLGGLHGPPGSRPPGTSVDWAASGMPTAGGTQGVRGEWDLSEVTQESWKKSDPPASSPWAVMARSTLPAGRRSAPFLEYTRSWTGCVHKYNHPQISPRLGYKAAFWRHALQSSLEGLAGGSAALSAHDPFWLSSRIMTPAAWVI